MHKNCFLKTTLYIIRDAAYHLTLTRRDRGMIAIGKNDYAITTATKLLA